MGNENGEARMTPARRTSRACGHTPACKPGTETWKNHPTIPGYMVSDQGRVRKMVDLLPQADKDGYHEVTLWIDGKKRRRGIHCLVLETFEGPRPAGQFGRHLNSAKADNRLSNLAWGTHKQNTADSLANGTIRRGEQVSWAKLTEAAVRDVRQRGTSKNAGLLASKYGVSRSTIMNVIDGKGWKHAS